MALQFTQLACLHTAAGGKHPLRLRIASGFWPRFRGLMFAPPLPASPEVHGLLLTDCASVHGCFMRYPLDVAYLGACDQSGACCVTRTARLKPWRVSAGKSVLSCPESGAARRVRSRHALELPAGCIASWHVAPGDQLRLM